MLVRPQLEYAVHLWSPYQTGLRENQSGHNEERQNWLEIKNIAVMKKDCTL